MTNRIRVGVIGAAPLAQDFGTGQAAVAQMRELGLDPDRVNVMGGGTAIGHPLGATGIRLTGTLARILEKKGGRYGCSNACVGGGQGVATIIEREEYDW